MNEARYMTEHALRERVRPQLRSCTGTVYVPWTMLGSLSPDGRARLDGWLRSELGYHPRIVTT